MIPDASLHGSTCPYCGNTVEYAYGASNEVFFECENCESTWKIMKI